MKKFSINRMLLLGLAIFMVSCSSAPVVSRSSELPYSYARLKLYDIDEMNDLVQKRAKSFNKSKDDKIMQEALLISLSRPNADNILEKLMNTVRFTLDSNDQWEEIVENIVDTSIARLKEAGTAPADQVTYLTALSNLLLEFKPEFYKPDVSPVFEKNITARIADANIKISDEAVSESSTSMYSVSNPSELAQNILEAIPQTKVKN